MGFCFLLSFSCRIKNNVLYLSYKNRKQIIMSQSSPEGIILGNGSELVSLELKINKEKVLHIERKPDTFLGWLDKFKKK